MAKSKLFRVFVEGNTISDGRTITAQMIDEIVATFNIDTYTPRINIEHISGYSPEPPFNGYGDVIAVEARTDDIVIDGKTEKRRALYAQVDGNDQLVKLAKAGQKPFPSVELTPAYAGIDKVGLIGLAFTDKPASIGTQKLQFSRSAPGTFFAAGADATDFGFEDEAEPITAPTLVAAFSASIDKVLAKFRPQDPTPPKAQNDNAFDPAAFATDLAGAMGEAMAAQLGKFATDNAAAIKVVTDKFAALETQLASEPAGGGFNRKPATGGAAAAFATDC